MGAKPRCWQLKGDERSGTVFPTWRMFKTVGGEGEISIVWSVEERKGRGSVNDRDGFDLNQKIERLDHTSVSK